MQEKGGQHTCWEHGTSNQSLGKGEFLAEFRVSTPCAFTLHCRANQRGANPLGGFMRPLGVTLSAYFQFVRALILAALALGVLVVGGTASRLAGLAAEGNSLQRFLAGFGHFVSMVLLIYACILLVLGIALLLGQNWSRTLTIVFSALGFLVLLPRVIDRRPLSVLIALLNLAVLIYLLLPQARFYFGRRNGSKIMPA
jgi:hypothetical protein